MPRVLLVRHGQSTWNVQRRYQGRADSPLTELGRAGAEELAERLHPILAGGQVALVASPLHRARDTAAIVGRRSAIGSRVDRRFVERDVGPWQGLTVAEIDARWPGDREAWRWPVGSETPEAVIDRVSPAIMELAGDPVGAVVITHAGVIRSLLTLSPGADHSIPNLGGSWFDVNAVDGVVAAAERFHLGQGPSERLDDALNDDAQSL